MPRSPDEFLVVVCKDVGVWRLATRQTFDDWAEAEAFAKECSPSREAHVVEGRFFQLRHPVHLAIREIVRIFHALRRTDDSDNAAERDLDAFDKIRAGLERRGILE